MDGGPYRVPRPADRRAANSRQEPIRQQADESQLSREEPTPVQRTTSPRQSVVEETKSFKRFIMPGIIVSLVVALAVMSWFMLAPNRSSSIAPAIDTSKYQAVFFTNGQVYFGKLASVNSEYLQLTDVYYLQNQQSTDEVEDPNNPQASDADQSSATLIKLGKEIHGPEDEMIISKEQVLFYENLKTDGSVSKTIAQDKSQN